jgi:dolichol-phosphate mannosyltransferase/undecaprenyl-phosphate 4-deoxy-4-formamido-L-arabinose transferase
VLVTVVIPVYNSPVLEELAARIAAVFAGRGEDYEIVFVDDGSTVAETWPTLDRLAAANRHVRAIQLTRNFGQQAATLCGLSESRGDVVITMDDDLQHAPEDIPRLLACQDYDIVIGLLGRRQHGALRRLASWTKAAFDSVLIGKPRGIRLSSFRMLSRSVVDGMIRLATTDPFLPALMFRVSRNAAAVPVSHHPRRAGRSGYTLPKLLRIFRSLLLSRSTPLQRLVASRQRSAPYEVRRRSGEPGLQTTLPPTCS